MAQSGASATLSPKPSPSIMGKRTFAEIETSRRPGFVTLYSSCTRMRMMDVMREKTVNPVEVRRFFLTHPLTDGNLLLCLCSQSNRRSMLSNPVD
jgi:hypothetical protein